MTKINCVTATVIHSCGHKHIYTIPAAFLNTIKAEKAANICPSCWDYYYYGMGMLRFVKSYS